MSSIFISYASQDRPFVERLENALVMAGHQVWFDRQLNAGDFRNQILDNLQSAEVAIVVWSARSRVSDYVLDESSRAKSMGKLLPVRIDRADLPLGFGVLQTFDLSSWSGRPDDATFKTILDQIEGIARNPVTAAQRPPIAVVVTSLVLAIVVAIVIAIVLTLLSALKPQPLDSANRWLDFAEGFAIAAACGAPVMIWSGFEVRRFGLSHWRLILRRAMKVYAYSALAALAFAAVATIGGVSRELSPVAALGQFGRVVIVATLVIGAAIAIARAVTMWIRSVVH